MESKTPYTRGIGEYLPQQQGLHVSPESVAEAIEYAFSKISVSSEEDVDAAIAEIFGE